MQTWEYHVVTLDTRVSDEQRDAQLARLGAASWELVTVVALALGTSPHDGGTTHERWVFKRPTLVEGSLQPQATWTAVEVEEAPRGDGDPTSEPGGATMKLNPRHRPIDRSPR
jgi:hypothetical protein